MSIKQGERSLKFNEESASEITSPPLRDQNLKQF